MTAKEAAPAGALVAQYRLFLSDPWAFRDSIRIGFEHGGGDGVETSERSVVFWYGFDTRAVRRTDVIDVGNVDAELAHSYTGGSSQRTVLKSFYEGDRDGNVSSPLFDLAIFPGAVPMLVADPRGESVADDGRRYPVGVTIRFRAAIDAANSGVILRRHLDQEVFDQRAGVRVDGILAGTWATPSLNDLKRFADSDFAVAPALTAGKSEIEVELTVMPPTEEPLVAGPEIDPPNEMSLPTTRALIEGGWTDFRYEVYSVEK